MPVYEREVRVAAPVEEVWEFHSRASGLEALTPGWMNLRIEDVVGPDGEPEPDVLETGSRIDSSVRPFGVGPRQRWTSEIVARERDAGAAMFRDVMTDGPFREWTHTHSFFADEGTTLVRDRVEYALPLDGLGDLLGPLAVVGFEPMFRYRHRKTRELLEDAPG
ncbi:cyclase [Halobacteriales archaeon QS_1_68_17]|nr:MAG: cyclase [Halobacteriales archaeon QS_1_68_17]